MKDMGDFIMVILGCIVLFVLSFLYGATVQEKISKRDAVKNGVAYWTNNECGAVEFKWKK